MDFSGTGCGARCGNQVGLDDLAALAPRPEFSFAADEQDLFEADYYCRPDDVVRSVGVHLAFFAEALGEDGAASAPPPPTGFDKEVPPAPPKPLAFGEVGEDLLPCACPWLMGAADSELGWPLGPAEELPPPPLLQQVPPPAPSHELDGADAGGDSAPGCPVRFEEGDAAPEQPKDPFFRLTVTSLLVKGLPAAAVGNALIDLLDSAKAGSVQKVSRAKCSVKARAVVGGCLWCVLKLRVYARPSEGGLAVEFRRCQGDGVAFNEVFQRAQSELRHLSLEVVHLS